MSLITKDIVIRNCANAYKEATGVESVKVGELATKIFEGLQAGGDLPEGIDIGDVTFNTSQVRGDFSVSHNLRVIPRYVFVWMADETTANVAKSIVKINNANGTISRVFYPDSSGNLTGADASAGDDTETVFYIPAMPSGVFIIPAYSYKYIAIK